ncbi:MAG: hypothetical protein GXP17_03560, partial [Gammaproteobacteria bacterium]|nr:hypothetical protein [Gammaproteobacteria bacterium]
MDMLSVRKVLAVVTFLFFVIEPSAQAEAPFNGVTKGAFAVSPTGAATYTIPIEVPPGIAGLQPELALSYNSQGGNGLLGMGWSLSGLSAITRCPKTYAQDGVKVGVKLDSTDRYCLNGQRLVVVNGLPYGANGAEYRTEIDSFAKITSYGTGENNDGPDHFIVQTKAGRIIEFGNTPDSNVNVTIQSNGQLRTLLWAANKISDTVGNELTISYIEEADIGHFRVSRIDYGNGNLSVRFEYPRDLDITSVRIGSITGYLAGAKYSTPTLLSNVKTYVGGSVVHDYHLEYNGNPTSDRFQSFITKISECIHPDNCKISSEFEWNSKSFGFVNLNGAIAESLVTGNFGTHWAYSRLTNDIDGDGIADLIWSYSGDLGLRAYTSIGKGDGTFYPATGGSLYTGNFGTYDAYSRTMGDVDGDGLLDLIWIYTGNLGVRVYTSIGKGDGAFEQATGGSLHTGNFGEYTAYSKMANDINGDGVADVVLSYSGDLGLRAYTSIGKGD